MPNQCIVTCAIITLGKIRNQGPQLSAGHCGDFSFRGREVFFAQRLRIRGTAPLSKRSCREPNRQKPHSPDHPGTSPHYPIYQYRQNASPGRRILPGIRDLASLSKTLARNRKSVRGRAATNAWDWQRPGGRRKAMTIGRFLFAIIGTFILLGVVLHREDPPAATATVVTRMRPIDMVEFAELTPACGSISETLDAQAYLRSEPTLSRKRGI